MPVKKCDTKKRILVVDDEENLRHVLTVVLKKQGYVVECAENGEAALGMLAAPALIAGMI